LENSSSRNNSDDKGKDSRNGDTDDYNEDDRDEDGNDDSEDNDGVDKDDCDEDVEDYQTPKYEVGEHELTLLSEPSPKQQSSLDFTCLRKSRLISGLTIFTRCAYEGKDIAYCFHRTNNASLGPKSQLGSAANLHCCSLKRSKCVVCIQYNMSVGASLSEGERSAT
jgi:hypothetical protein